MNLQEAYIEWLEKSRKPFIAKAAERRAKFETSSGLEVPAVAAPAAGNLSAPGEQAYIANVGFPGEWPFTRGVYPSMYRGRFWTMRQYAGFGDAEESNRRYRYLLEQGTTGLSVAFDLPTQIGYDSDHVMAEGEVGKVGVPIACLDDMATLLDKIPLDQVSTSMTINSSAALLLSFYLLIAERQGVPYAKLRGTVQNDLLKEFVARGTYIFPPKPSLRLTTDIIAFCAAEVPNFNAISISGYHMREAGSTAAQEIAFTLAHGLCYVEQACKRGLKVDAFGKNLSFFFNGHNNLLEEVAKFRAARRLWARLMKERFGAVSKDALSLKFHTQTAGSTLTAQQPENNIVRTTLQALAAVLGGTQSLHTNSFDEALALPTEESVEIALRTQQVIAHESGVADTPDPLAGSYLVERWTDELESRALEYIRKIDEMGGAVAAIERKFPQGEIARAALAYQRQVEKGEAVLVGVNKFQTQEQRPAELLKIDPASTRRQLERLSAFKARRNHAKAKAALHDVAQAAKTDANMVPSILGALRQEATLGEVCDAMRNVFGEYRES
ncbi:MAG: methylmalonyl-CoA mutase [Planctomycetota bacterium]|nr:methylmalonyl-CoA mutase [Planctomycetota bacterium]GIK51402.1 MAG: methylmalonyl-CoA mutase [Planctomycetota bacterium]